MEQFVDNLIDNIDNTKATFTFVPDNDRFMIDINGVVFDTIEGEILDIEFDSKQRPCVPIDNRLTRIDKLIVKTFIKKETNKCKICFKNGNKKDFSMKNIFILDKRICIHVVENGKIRKLHSDAALARHLRISELTVSKMRATNREFHTHGGKIIRFIR